MFGWARALFSVPKVAGTVTDLAKEAASGIDALFFTDEEKARASKEILNVWLESQKILQGESSIRSITRRILAVMILGVFLVFLLWAAFVWPWFNEWSVFLFNCAKTLSNLVLAIAVFYFGSYAIGTHILDKKE